MLASRVFSAMLRHSYFREGAELRAHGAVEVELHDDNAQALLTALMVVHGRLRRVPRAVDLAALGHIAIIIDKYGLHEALREHGNMWFNRLQKQDRDTGTARHRRFLWWLVVAWVLRHGNNFRTLTRIAQQNWDGPLGTGAQPRIPSGFPVPATVLGMVFYLSLHSIPPVIFLLSILATPASQKPCSRSTCPHTSFIALPCL
jgi:hypothetical protein